MSIAGLVLMEGWITSSTSFGSLCACVCVCVCVTLESQDAPLTIIILDPTHIVCPRRVSSFQKECTPKMINSKMKMK